MLGDAVRDWLGELREMSLDRPAADPPGVLGDQPTAAACRSARSRGSQEFRGLLDGPQVHWNFQATTLCAPQRDALDTRRPIPAFKTGRQSPCITGATAGRGY